MVKKEAIKQNSTSTNSAHQHKSNLAFPLGQCKITVTVVLSTFVLYLLKTCL